MKDMRVYLLLKIWQEATHAVCCRELKLREKHKTMLQNVLECFLYFISIPLSREPNHSPKQWLHLRFLVREAIPPNPHTTYPSFYLWIL